MTEKRETGIERKTTCTTAGALFVDVEDDRIVRLQPMHFDPEEVQSWNIEVNGKTYKPPLTQPLLPWGTASKQIIYSENRVKHPLKRVDWEPLGNRMPENRGISGYERISWDEMYDILEREMRRIIDTYGPSAFCWSHCAHPEWGQVHYFYSDLYRFWNMVGGTYREFSPNSWEGWAAGATFVWGYWPLKGLIPSTDLLQDVAEDSDLIVLWGTEPLFHNIYSGIDTARALKYFKDLGKSFVLIDPLYNETGLAVDAKWLRIVPGTDAALAAAIAHTWIVEGTYDQAYLDTHAIGFDEEHLPEGAPANSSFKSYILGLDKDGIEKTPAWAAEICGIPAYTIQALAREWGSKPTSLWSLFSGTCRRQYAHEHTRMQATLLAMQGLGKPGVNAVGSVLTLCGPYDAQNQIGPTGYVDGGINVVMDNYTPNIVRQFITFQKFNDCVKNPPQQWRGGHMDSFNAEMFWEEATYPAKGCSPVHFIWQRGSTMTNPPDHKRDIIAYRDASIETIVICAPWFDRECRYADLVLPITTAFEHQDITEPGSVAQMGASGMGLRSAVFHQQTIKPIGESKTDLEIFEELSRRLGYGDTYLEGNTEETIIRKIYDTTTIPMEYEAFKEKGYYVWPAPTNYKPNKEMKGFYEDPEANPVDTPTGKLEIFSTQLFKKYGPDNPDIPPVPHYIPEREGPANAALAERFPLQMCMAHPKFRFHGKYNDVEWLSENYKVYGPDGYPYEPVCLNPADAADRGLSDGDIVRVFNDRGSVLAGVKVTDRLTTGVAWLTYGAWNDPVDPEAGALDRGGDGNVLTQAEPMSDHYVSGAYNSCMIEIEAADLDALSNRYPEGFAGAWSTWNREG